MPPPTTPQTMTCMEVWGGSDATDSAVTLSGLDAWVYSRPYEQADAGGDVYYVSACATGRINRLLVADVAGHGTKVRDVARQLRDLMRRYVNYLDQSRFVLSMNNQFVECSAAGCFATAIVSTFFAPTRTLTLCNAGHPPPLLYRAATQTWSLLGADACGGTIPLGIVDLENCDQFTTQLEVNDLLLVYTDSLIEAKFPNGDMLGPQGLVTLVTESTNPTQPETIIPTLLKTIDTRTDGGLRADDVTTLLLRPNGTGARPPITRALAAPIKILASALTRRGPLALPDFTLANIGGALIPALNRLWSRRKTARPSRGASH